MRVLVYGAGPLGSLMAARLHEAGHDVSLLARRQRLADIREHGVVIHEAGAAEPEVARVPAVEALAGDDDYDLVMVVMRKDQAVHVLPTLADNRRVGTFLFMMNNAEGPGRFVDAVGAQRVMLGFPYPGGSRDGHVMRVPPVNERKRWTIPIGEIDGVPRPRTEQVADALGSMRGYRVQVRDDMDAWLKYHAAVLMPAFAPAMYAAGIDMKRLGRTRDLLVLTTRGIKEALRGLRKDVGIPPAPRALRLLELLPEPLWVALFAAMMRAEYAKDSLEGHPRAARDELRLLTEELMAILRAAGAPTPSIDRLAPYYDPDTPPWPDGAKDVPMRWGGVLAPGLALAVAGLVLARARRR